METRYGKFTAPAPQLSEEVRSKIAATRPTDLNEYAAQSRNDNDRWWYEPTCWLCGLPLHLGKCVNMGCNMLGKHIDEPNWRPMTARNKGELLALIHSEISECLEGVRKSLPDDKLPHRSMEEVELADALIRIFDYAGAFGLDLEGAYQEKRAYNAVRVDHTLAARAAEGGKAF